MSNILWSMVAGALAGLASCIALLRFNFVQASQTTDAHKATAAREATAPSTPPEATAPSTPPPPQSPAPHAGSAPVPDTIAAILPPLAKTLSPLAEEVSHPRELLDMPEFQAVVEAFRRPDATMALLSQYALGASWPLACAAFLVLAERPERQSLCDSVLRHLPNTRPYVLMYTFGFLASLEQRPPVGAVLLAAPKWWQDNVVIPGFIHDYFAQSAQLGDRPDFGNYLEAKTTELDNAETIVELLQVPPEGW